MGENPSWGMRVYTDRGGPGQSAPVQAWARHEFKEGLGPSRRAVESARVGGFIVASQRRSIFMILSFLAVSATIGGLTGSGGETVKAASKAVTDEAVTASINSFTKIYSVVDDNFAEKVDPGKGIYKGAIPGMLRTLDPHSNFFDPKEFAGLKEEQHGKYYGVGMQIGPQPRTGKVMVIAPFGGTPAYKAGLRPGDVLLEVNDKRVDNLSVSDVADLLRGPKGTKVQIVASREGMSKPMTFNVVR